MYIIISNIHYNTCIFCILIFAIIMSGLQRLRLFNDIINIIKRLRLFAVQIHKSCEQQHVLYMIEYVVIKLNQADEPSLSV